MKSWNGPVIVISTDDGADVPLGLRVEGLGELHDVDAVLTQRGTDRRRRLAAPAGICSLIWVRTFWPWLDLLHLVVVDFDRSLAAEDGDEH
jgi:hypothetical protein